MTHESVVRAVNIDYQRDANENEALTLAVQQDRNQKFAWTVALADEMRARRQDKDFTFDGFVAHLGIFALHWAEHAPFTGPINVALSEPAVIVKPRNAPVAKYADAVGTKFNKPVVAANDWSATGANATMLYGSPTSSVLVADVLYSRGIRVAADGIDIAGRHFPGAHLVVIACAPKPHDETQGVNLDSLGRAMEVVAPMSQNGGWLQHWLPGGVAQVSPVKIRDDWAATNEKCVAIYPSASSPRIVAQRGRFTVHGARRDPIEDQLSASGLPALAKFTFANPVVVRGLSENVRCHARALSCSRTLTAWRPKFTTTIACRRSHRGRRQQSIMSIAGTSGEPMETSQHEDPRLELNSRLPVQQQLENFARGITDAVWHANLLNRYLDDIGTDLRTAIGSVRSDDLRRELASIAAPVFSEIQVRTVPLELDVQTQVVTAPEPSGTAKVSVTVGNRAAVIDSFEAVAHLAQSRGLFAGAWRPWPNSNDSARR